MWLFEVAADGRSPCSASGNSIALRAIVSGSGLYTIVHRVQIVLPVFRTCRQSRVVVDCLFVVCVTANEAEMKSECGVL